jgi:hypothetical protein
MGLPMDRQMNRLPKRFPAGTIYVVEGRGGQHGRLRVSTRYVIMPSGRRVDIPVDLDRVAGTGTNSGQFDVASRQKYPSNLRQKNFCRSKKYEGVPGTALRKQR